VLDDPQQRLWIDGGRPATDVQCVDPGTFEMRRVRVDFRVNGALEPSVALDRVLHTIVRAKWAKVAAEGHVKVKPNALQPLGPRGLHCR
jgi:hypothetical protein